jgi:hypothetical protein
LTLFRLPSLLAGVALTAVLLNGCTRTVYLPESGVVSDGLYDTPLSHVGADDVFERAFSAIHFLNSVAFYKELTFPAEAGVQPEDLKEDRAEALASGVEMYHRTASGTATVVHRSPVQIALVTSAHVVAFPDTVLSFYEGDQGRRSVRTLAVKVRQTNYVPDVPGADRMGILVLDDERDVAILGQLVPDLPAGLAPVIDFPAGTADDLQWGSEVFVFGYPAGTRMMTTGLVSKTRRERRNLFLTDANFNRGFSGGLVLAVRDGVPNFEWIGIATAGAAATEITVAPEDTMPLSEDDLDQPYDGPLVLRQQKRLRYGITTCTTIDAVKAVLREHAADLARRGYQISLP